jgi:hypothetical protein
VGRLADLGQDEDGICLPAHVLASLGLEVAIEAFYPIGKAGSHVLLPEQRNPKVLQWPLRHSRHDPALMRRKSLLEPLARHRGTDQSIEEHSAVPVRQDNSLMLPDRQPSGVSEHGYTEIGQLTEFELGRPLDQQFAWLVDPETESL